MLATLLLGMPVCLGGLAAAAGAESKAMQQAERLAGEALREAEAAPDAALAKARRALQLTAEFEPTDFVGMGRKGEVVEDEFVAARLDYRRHRAGLYEAVGACLAQKGEQRPASRYLGRAVLLDPQPDRVARLAAALLAEGRARAALEKLGPTLASGTVAPGLLRLLEQAVDLAGWASVQVQLDRARLAAFPKEVVQVRDGPVRPLPPARLSTGAPLVFDQSPVILYLADTSCRTCSADLEDLKRAVSNVGRVVMLAEDPDRDYALRQVLSLYRHSWPVLGGRGQATALGAEAGAVLVVARSGFLAATVRKPFAEHLPRVLGILAKADVSETLPRGSWNRTAPDRSPEAPAPAFLPEGLAPGEDEAAPGPFTAGVDAYRSRRPLEALRFFDSLADRADGWLLPPEQRFNRARCLAALGRREEARRLLLRIGDSRFQDQVDRALEEVGSRRSGL